MAPHEYSGIPACPHPQCNGSEEVWHPICSFENLYEVSNHGRVKSLGRVVSQWQYKAQAYFPNTRHNHQPMLLKFQQQRNGYRRVSLLKNGVRTRASVHRLVLEAFVPNKEHKPWANHKDGDRGNDHVENLEWCTPLENNQHMMKVLKTHRSGTAQHADIETVLLLREQGHISTHIAKMLGMKY